MAQLQLLLLAIALLFLAQCHANKNLEVTCGSSIKLQHVATKSRLHSHELAYPRGSGQQMVTNFPTGDDANSLWIVHGTAEAPCTPGETIKKGASIRLQHAASRRWLHSHHFQSPASGNLEVSAFGGDRESDSGDVWSVEWDGKAGKASPVWKQDTKVRLRHTVTNALLYSMADMRYGHPISGQIEVCGKDSKDKNAEWQAAEGVYWPVNASADKAADAKEL